MPLLLLFFFLFIYFVEMCQVLLMKAKEVHLFYISMQEPLSYADWGEYKMVMVVRQDLGMGKGKAAAQVSCR